MYVAATPTGALTSHSRRLDDEGSEEDSPCAKGRRPSATMHVTSDARRNPLALLMENNEDGILFFSMTKCQCRLKGLCQKLKRRIRSSSSFADATSSLASCRRQRGQSEKRRRIFPLMADDVQTCQRCQVPVDVIHKNKV